MKTRIVIVLILFPLSISAQTGELVFPLHGMWKFDVGDHPCWSHPSIDDSKWDEIPVPGNWEEVGYQGYDGFAWYRLSFDLPTQISTKQLSIFLGRIDDVSEIYLNGHFVGGAGNLPPEYFTAFDFHVEVFPSETMWNPSGKNVIAVRVYDGELTGGILGEQVGIYTYEKILPLLKDLSGEWKLKKGDHPEWKNILYDDSKWQLVSIPNHWDRQGFENYDGFGWYRLEFILNEPIPNKELVILLGKIDDVNETYLNEKFIGATGSMPTEKRGWIPGNNDTYKELRGYVISSSDLTIYKPNMLAVRVYDNFLAGGIYSGPIGITTKYHWDKYQQTIRPTSKYARFYQWVKTFLNI